MKSMKDFHIHSFDHNGDCMGEHCYAVLPVAAQEEDTNPCPECGGIGYLLNDLHAGDGPIDPSLPLSLNITACYYPTHTAPIRPIATLGLGQMFTEVVRHPTDGTIMAVTGFTKPDYR